MAVAAVLIVAVSAVAIGSDGADADYETVTDGQGVIYELRDHDVAWVVGYEPYLEGDVVIPETVEDGNGKEYRVLALEDQALYDCDGITSLYMPSIQYMGNMSVAFSGSITSVYIPLVTEIGDTGLRFCKSLRYIDVGDDNPVYASVDGVVYDREMSILELVPTAYEGDYTAPDTVLYVNSLAFYSCKHIVNVSLPNVTVFMSFFGGCDSLRSVQMPQAKVVMPLTFSDCPLLESIDLSGVEMLMDEAVTDCPNLREIAIGGDNPSYTNVGGIVYSKDMTRLVICPGATAGDIDVPESVVRVSASAFNGCVG